MTVNDSTDPGLWDPNGGSILSSLEFLYMDSLFGADWTANPSVQNYQLSYWDESYVTGDLLSDWEFNTPGVLTMHVPKVSTGKICRRLTDVNSLPPIYYST